MANDDGEHGHDLDRGNPLSTLSGHNLALPLRLSEMPARWGGLLPPIAEQAGASPACSCFFQQITPMRCRAAWSQ